MEGEKGNAHTSFSMRNWSWSDFRAISFGMWRKQRKDRCQKSLGDVEESKVFIKFVLKNYSSFYSFRENVRIIKWHYVLISSKSLKLPMPYLILLGDLFVILVNNNLKYNKDSQNNSYLSHCVHSWILYLSGRIQAKNLPWIHSSRKINLH